MVSPGSHRQVFVCDGRIIEMHPGDIFYVEPGHDSWVIGAEPYVSIHMMGADD